MFYRKTKHLGKHLGIISSTHHFTNTLLLVVLSLLGGLGSDARFGDDVATGGLQLFHRRVGGSGELEPVSRSSSSVLVRS